MLQLVTPDALHAVTLLHAVWHTPLGDPPLPQVNYASDKGWGPALESFCRAVVEGKTPRNATAIDGNRATLCAVSARRSIETGLPVRLDPRDWL